MAVNFTNQEFADMHFMYGRANGNAAEAARLYTVSYPNRRHPDRRMFSRIHQRLCERGSFDVAPREGRPRTVRTPALEERVLQRVDEEPGTSTRRIALAEHVSRNSVWRILHVGLLRPYHLQRVQALGDNDYPARVEFCRWLQQTCAANPDFLRNVLFTDEAGFTRDGIVNFHNTHVWAYENPHATVESRHQQRFSLNVWAGLVGDHLIGPYVLPNRLNGQAYLTFLRDDLPDLLDDIPLLTRQRMWLMHDGAPAHFLLEVRRHLNEQFGDRWIGRGGPHPWPPRSPDLNPLDFCIWGYVKGLVYSSSVDTVAQLRQRVNDAFQQVRENQGLCARIRASLRRRAEACIQANGGHFEQLL